MALTDAQQSAVDIRDRTLLVSAAAGSGKTYTLTQRIIKSIIEDGQDLSRLLIVTFTRAAAGELKEKISKALSTAIAEHPNDLHLQSQLIKLGSAHISTIDSFFTEPVRSNFEKLGLPASIRLADDAELSPTRDKILQETLEHFFEACEPYEKCELSNVGYRSTYTDLIGIISSARDSSKILPSFWDIYKKLITSPLSLSQLKIHAERMRENAKKDLFQTKEGQFLKRELYSNVTYVRKTLLSLADELASDPSVCSRYYHDFTDNAQLCHSLLNAIENGTYADVKFAFEAFSPSKITPIRSNEKTEQSEAYKNMRSKLNDIIKKDLRQKYLCAEPNEISNIFNRYADVCDLLFNILTEFERRYSDEKRRRGICEFSDMPKFMLSLLLDEHGEPGDYAKALRARFDEVYIDEYQDVNEIQDTIFALIGGDHRFMVGDIKQSIYGFREAEPSIFADYRSKLPAYRPNDKSSLSPNGNTVFMSENFRCDENIITFTNTVCSLIFSSFADGIGYTSDDDLRFGKKKPFDEYQSPCVTLNIIEPSDCDNKESDSDDLADDFENADEISDSLSDEAMVIANEIVRLLKTEKNANGSPIMPSDIAVLTRSHSYTKAVISALNVLKVNYVVTSKGEIFETDDMRLLTDLLSVVDNPRSDIPLCQLLTEGNESISPFFSFEDVVKIRKYADLQKDGARSLFDAMYTYAESGNDKRIADLCQSFISLMEKMRASACKMSADKFIKSLAFCEKYAQISETDAYMYVYDSACKYVKNTWSGLYGFLKYFNGVAESGGAGSEPDAGQCEAVRLMSVHQSKGLEFNVCFLFGFGKQFNMKSKYPILFNKDLGISVKLPPSIEERGDVDTLRVRYESNPIYRISDKYIKIRQLEEEARIFYVALTRARERLYISATLSKPFADYYSSLAKCADIDYEIKKSKTYIKWILLALSSSPVSEDVYEIKVHQKGNVTRGEAMSEPQKEEREQISNATEDELELAHLLASPIQDDSNARLLSLIPSKVAASKVSSDMLDNSIFIPIPAGKLFTDESDDDSVGQVRDDEELIKGRIELMRASKKDFDSLLAINQRPTAAEIGTATHSFLQFCNYENVNKNGIESELKRLTDMRFISKRMADIISLPQLRGFFKSELYGIILNAKTVYREFHFGDFKSASDFTQDEKLKVTVADRKIYVQGSIDLLAEESDGSIVLCDYKTDRVTAEERADRSLLIKNIKKRHGNQLDQYKYAVEQIFGLAPSKTFVYLFSIGEAIEL